MCVHAFVTGSEEEGKVLISYFDVHLSTSHTGGGWRQARLARWRRGGNG